jgi:hypothetical protein
MSDVAPQKPYRWTVMIYLAGDNNLTDECVHALTQMKEVEGLDEQGICVLAQLDPKGGQLKSHRYKLSHVSKEPSLKGDYQNWEKNKNKPFVHRWYRDYAAINRERFENRGSKNDANENTSTDETNTGSPITLFDFVTWCVEKYPAESYMLVLSGHGGGTEKGYMLRDEHPADALTIWEMQVGLDVIHDQHGDLVIDILGMDCCLMTMAEVSYQLRNRAKLMVGSEGYSPIAGWPFKPVLTRMRDELSRINDSNTEQRKERERIAIANGVVEEYVKYYVDYDIGGLSVEQSSLDLRKTKELTDAINNLAKVLSDEFPADDVKAKRDFNHALVLSHWKAQSYNGEQFVDLYDFCALLREHYGYQHVLEACDAVLETEKSFVTRSCHNGPTYQYSRGVSIYFPWAEIDPNYAAARFGRDSEWVKFLEKYIVATRREPRDPDARGYGDNSQPYAMRHTAGKHAPGKAMLPEILSMRNPPVSAGVSPCVPDHQYLEESLKGMHETWLLE